MSFNNIFAVNINEVEILYELFKKLSSSIVDDGLISKVSLENMHYKVVYKGNLKHESKDLIHMSYLWILVC